MEQNIWEIVGGIEPKEVRQEKALKMVRSRPDMVAAVPYVDPLCKANGITPEVYLEAQARSALFSRQPSNMRVAQGVHRGA